MIPKNLNYKYLRNDSQMKHLSSLLFVVLLNKKPSFCHILILGNLDFPPLGNHGHVQQCLFWLTK